MFSFCLIISALLFNDQLNSMISASDSKFKHEIFCSVSETELELSLDLDVS